MARPVLKAGRARWLAFARRDHRLATDLKNRVYALIEADPSIERDVRCRDHLAGAVSSTPRLIAEGFGRYLPGDFSGYLRKATAS